MPSLPTISGDEAVRAFERLGYVRVRQRGSHIRPSAPGREPLTVPRKRELKRGTLRALIRDAGITVEEFADLL